MTKKMYHSEINVKFYFYTKRARTLHRCVLIGARSLIQKSLHTTTTKNGYSVSNNGSHCLKTYRSLDAKWTNERLNINSLESSFGPIDRWLFVRVLCLHLCLFSIVLNVYTKMCALFHFHPIHIWISMCICTLTVALSEIKHLLVQQTIGINKSQRNFWLRIVNFVEA